jgi:hypothetical protein
LLAGGGNDPCTPKTGKKPTQEGEGVYPMFFATQTVAGLKVEFSAVGGATPVPSGFVFGYRRKEASAIRVSRVPAGDLKESDDCVPNNGFEHVIYPPVLASIDLQAAAGANAQGGAEPALINCQFFATGEAARRVARLGLPGLDCNAISQQTFAKYYDTKEQLQEQGLRTLSCYVRLKPEQRPLVWKDMTRLELWGDLADDEKDPKGKKHPEQIALRHFEGAKLGGEAGRRALAAADEVYTTSLGPAGSLAGFEEGRVRAMQAHRKLVCDLAAVK